eukprot:TRINITY_DN11724_c0_g1_i3.p3 TRINITY_DN11724_c0_g1~~TRINITY_DN11724_c0_g1_i3.p3  ORF type:complete len:107 (-),score=1.78 TRINITY_DN11724_c0_g1_i3:68-388(-)
MQRALRYREYLYNTKYYIYVLACKFFIIFMQVLVVVIFLYSKKKKEEKFKNIYIKLGLIFMRIVLQYQVLLIHFILQIFNFYIGIGCNMQVLDVIFLYQKKKKEET